MDRKEAWKDAWKALSWNERCLRVLCLSTVVVLSCRPTAGWQVDRGPDRYKAKLELNAFTFYKGPLGATASVEKAPDLRGDQRPAMWMKGINRLNRWLDYHDGGTLLAGKSYALAAIAQGGGFELRVIATHNGQLAWVGATLPHTSEWKQTVQGLLNVVGVNESITDAKALKPSKGNPYSLILKSGQTIVFPRSWYALDEKAAGSVWSDLNTLVRQDGGGVYIDVWEDSPAMKRVLTMVKRDKYRGAMDHAGLTILTQQVKPYREAFLIRAGSEVVVLVPNRLLAGTQRTQAYDLADGILRQLGSGTAGSPLKKL